MLGHYIYIPRIDLFDICDQISIVIFVFCFCKIMMMIIMKWPWYELTRKKNKKEFAIQILVLYMNRVNMLYVVCFCLFFHSFRTSLLSSSPKFVLNINIFIFIIIFPLELVHSLDFTIFFSVQRFLDCLGCI